MKKPKQIKALAVLTTFACGLAGALQAAEVRVETEFGQEKVAPRAGTITVPDNSEQTFDAPQFVYLNRYFEELDALGDVSAPVLSVVITGGGNDYTSPPVVTFSGGGGSGATGDAFLADAGPVAGVTISAGGNYASDPTVTFSGGGGSGATGTVVRARSIDSVSITNGGSNYSSAPTVTFTGGGGNGATGTATLNGSGQVTGVNITNGGSDYTSAPAVTFSGGGGSGAAANAVLDPVGPVTGVTITNGGSNYTSDPVVTFSGGGGGGAAGTAVRARAVGGVTITDNGSSYTSAPTVTFTGGGGSGATGRTLLDESKMAFYRARNVGYAIDGDLVQGAERFFKETVKPEGITIVWKWELDYAVFIESGSTNGQPLPGAPGGGIGNPLPEVGRHWVARDSEFSGAVDRTVGNDTLGLDISGFRYSAEQYELENVRGPELGISGDTYWKFVEATGGGGNQFFRESNLDANLLPPQEGLTIAWWGKIDRRLDSGRDELFIQLWPQGDNLVWDYRTVPALNEARIIPSTHIGVRPDGQFFVEEFLADGASAKARNIATVPSSLVGLDWHHWSVIFDYRETSVTVASETEVIPVPFEFLAGDTGLLVQNTTDDEFLDLGTDFTSDPVAGTITLINTAATEVGEDLLISGTREIRIYRDTVLVLKKALTQKPSALNNDTNRITYGSSRYRDTPAGPLKFENLEGGLNNFAAWHEALHPDSPNSPFIERLDQNARSNAATAGEDRFNPMTQDAPPYWQALPFPPEARTALRTDKGPVDLGNTGNRVVSETVTIDDWLRLRWKWSAQVRYTISASGGSSSQSDSPFMGQSFVRTFNFDNPMTPADESLIPKASTPTAPNPQFGLASLNLIWIDVGTKVEVGSFYRTFDRCFTLADFVTKPSGDVGAPGPLIANLIDLTLDDDQGRPRVARVFKVPAARAPTQAAFRYQPTIFRAEVPLGQSFDAMNPDLQLVPALCEGAELRTGNLGFSEASLISIPEGGPPGRTNGLPVRWDQLGKQALPVQPGSYQLDWPDANSTPSNPKSYKIEVVTGYPEDTVPLSFSREKPSGERENTALPGQPPAYVNEITLEGTDSKFPAFPRAHYRHHFDSKPERTPPTRLDLSNTDHWKFQELTYSDPTTQARVDAATAGVSFNSLEGRTVLLYSYRPNPDEVADGTPADENLSVRVVESSPVAPIEPDSLLNPLGRRGLELGSGASQDDGALGVISRNTSTHAINPGPNFVLDFWLNTKHLQLNDDPVTVLSTGDGKMEVILDPATLTITANYFDLSATHSVSMAGAGWSHFVIHVFGETFFGIPVTLLDFYADGIRTEDGVVTALLETAHNGHSLAINAASGLGANSLRLGAGANPESRLRLDQLRLFSVLPAASQFDPTYLSPGEVRTLRELRTSQLRGDGPLLHFDFELEPTNPGTGAFSFANTVTVVPVGVGPRFGNDPTRIWEGLWARLDIQEVATRLDSPLDDADFNGSGYIMNQISNYNANLYQRDAEVGTWGPVFPVNEKRLYDKSLRRLEIAYYENPFRRDELSHPNVAWPYLEAAYNEVIYPKYGPHRDKAIYIASRAGSEGVDRDGKLQQVFGLEEFANLLVYNQPNDEQAGYNPNEEHALAAGSNRAGLKVKEIGEDLPNNPPLAAFALQNDINVTYELEDQLTGARGIYTSEPWVLIQVDNLVTGEPEMAAYEVFKTRLGSVHFPRPPDADVNALPGLTYQSAPNPEDRFLLMDPEETHDFAYSFSYPVAAGDLLRPPYPLSLVIGNVAMLDARGGNDSGQRTLWRDVYGNPWVVSGNGTFFYQYFYPFRNDFFLPGTALGTPVAWVPDETNGRRAFTGIGSSLQPGKVVYHSIWRSGYPKLKRGETLTYQGGEFFNENPGSNGLPALVAMKAAEIIYDVATPTMKITDSNVEAYSARIIRPLDRYESRFEVSEMADAGYSPAAPSIFVVAERWYFKDLAGSLQKRFYFDSLAEKFVFRGYLNDKDSGDPDLTAGPDPINILEPNVITDDDLTELMKLATTTALGDAITAIYNRSQNPTLIRETATPEMTVTGAYLAGVRESPIETEALGLNFALLPEPVDVAAENDEIAFLASELRNLEKGWNITTDVTKYSQYKALIAAYPQYVQQFRAFFASRITSPAEKDISRYGYNLTEIIALNPTRSRYSHLNSFGVGSALVANSELLTAPVNGSRYVTIVENNRRELDGAPVSLHIVEIIPDRYRGALKVIEAADAFSEKVTIQHNADFGANTGDIYYEWWIRDAAPLGVINNPTDREIRADATLKEADLSNGQTLWQEYLPKSRLEDNSLSAFEKHLGLHSIVFSGSPDVTLSDKLVLMRYRHRDEEDWSLVPFEFADATAEWQPGIDQANPPNVTGPAPFQWAGAANSPQIQASGEKVYIPQLVMGWVKRVLDRINPYEARYTDFFSNESPATYSSQIQIAGAPFAGKVALNPDKNVIENTGLIELYETVLARAKELSIENSEPSSTPGINQALLLAATRLAVLYELLAREAYSDAQDSTITVTDENLAGVASFTHAFQNFEASLLHEELALLRGTDFRKSYPVFNRLFWNYAKGLGEAAYNVNYNIYDENTDGFINEDDARALYPQGHGDSWGHYMSALGMHYELLRNNTFSWATRSELYALMQNVLEVDFLDEKTFAKLAAGKARAGRDIVRGTYRLHYTQEPAGQWQGYSDGADPARAWGVSEWAHRTGQAAYFDWAVANALLPEEAADGTPVPNPENLDRIERLGALDEIGEIAGGLYEIQVAMDEANGGVNPLGFDSDAIAFDIDPYFDGLGWERQTHFEQIYNRAVEAGTNALATLDFATKAGNKLRHLADDTDTLIIEAVRQDIDYRNRLIEIFGRPYDGTIGFGKVYPEGYEGPDTQLFAYLDHTTITEIIPQTDSDAPASLVRFESTINTATGLADDSEITSLYADVLGNVFENIAASFTSPFGNNLGIGQAELREAFITLIASRDYEDFTEDVGEGEIPIRMRSPYAFQAFESWGQRTSYGKVQRILEEELRERIALDSAINTYVAFLQDFEVVTNRLRSEMTLVQQRANIHNEVAIATLISKVIQLALDAARKASDQAASSLLLFGTAASEGFPKVIGFSNDATSIGRAAVLVAAATANTGFSTAGKVAEKLAQAAQIALEALKDERKFDAERSQDIATLEGLLVTLVSLSGNDVPMRDAIGIHLQNIELKRQEYFSAQAEGFRLLREREAFNKILAAKVQKNRYNDMVVRLTRNEAMSKYQSAFNHAARYAWMATKAYDYETNLDEGNPAAPGQLLDQIVRERQLGLWSDGQPQTGQGGLAEILHHLNGNFQVLKGQLGLNNPQAEFEKISLRSELFRIGAAGNPASDGRWEDAIKARIVPDLTRMPEFSRYCRPFADAASGPQPGIVIRFPTSIEAGRNFFGHPLGPGDHSYSTANFATKVRGFGAWLENYNAAGLSTTPRAYLVPVGNDYMRHSSAPQPATRVWNVQEQRIPIPFVINDNDLKAPGFIPTLNGVDGRFVELRRHGDFRMYHDEGGGVDESELILDSRLIGRSVWNSEWLLIIPGAGLHVDPDTGLTQLAEAVSDIKLHFQTYSHSGQ